MFLIWQNACGARSNCVDGLKYIIHHRVTNLPSMAVAKKILGRMSNLKAWQGTPVDVDSDDGHALLGSPNGRSVAYLLVDRKDTFEGKTIEQMNVFGDDDGDLCFLFWLST